MGDIRDFYKQQRTCCLAIPLFASGIMAILYFNTFLALFFAGMAFAGPKILALVQPRILSYVFGALYLAVAGLHIFGIICVERNYVSRFRIFKTLSLYVTGATLALGLVFILVSAAQHSTSIDQCMAVYHFPVDSKLKMKNAQSRAGVSSAVNAAMTVCDLFCWLQVGVMVATWVALALIQLYFGSKHSVYFELKHPDYLEDTARVP